tara:strand:- start:701 stop:1108 length:408 start_codon:yes stop_codon:yes gene_type:complete
MPIKMKLHKTVQPLRFPIVRFVSVSFLLSGLISAQKVEPDESYKTALRMKLNVDIEPLFYMDELKSGQLNKVHYGIVGYLDLAEQKATKYELISRAKIIQIEAQKFSQIKYDRIIPVKTKENIRYNYFSSRTDRD